MVVRRLAGLGGPVFVALEEVAEVSQRPNWARVQMKSGHRLRARGDAESVRALLLVSSNEVSPRCSRLLLVVEIAGRRKTRAVAVEEIAALDLAPEKGWSLVVLKGGEKLRVVGHPAQIMRTGASPRAVLMALAMERESATNPADQVGTTAPKKEGDT